MMARIRRSRFALLALLALSPAGLGTVLPVLHPCPVDAPWLAHHGVRPRPDPSHHGQHDSKPDTSEKHTCTCVGSCLSSAVPALGSAAPVERTREILFRPGWSGADASLDLQPLSNLLPPATAPPLV